MLTLISGSMKRSSENFTSSAVTGSPLENIASRRWNVQVRPSHDDSQLSARPGPTSGSVSGSASTSVLKICTRAKIEPLSAGPIGSSDCVSKSRAMISVPPVIGSPAGSSAGSSAGSAGSSVGGAGSSEGGAVVSAGGAGSAASSLSPPQPAAANARAPTASSSASAVARLRCLARPLRRFPIVIRSSVLCTPTPFRRRLSRKTIHQQVRRTSSSPVSHPPLSPPASATPSPPRRPSTRGTRGSRRPPRPAPRAASCGRCLPAPRTTRWRGWRRARGPPRAGCDRRRYPR